MENPLVNIITRTSNRPKFFFMNHNSVMRQTHSRIRHLVSYDDEITWDYLEKYARIGEIDVINTPRPPYKKDRFPYNLYCNRLMKEVKEGWIMFLDDDDFFLEETAIQEIVGSIKSEDDLLLWRVKFPDRIVPKHLNKRPKMGDIAAIGFMFNFKHMAKCIWDDRQGSDYRVISKLYKQLNPVWIDRVLTGVNYQCRRTFGSGQRIDLAILSKEDQEAYNEFINEKFKNNMRIETLEKIEHKEKEIKTKELIENSTMPKVTTIKKKAPVIQKKSPLREEQIVQEEVKVQEDNDIEDILDEIAEIEEQEDNEEEVVEGEVDELASEEIEDDAEEVVEDEEELEHEDEMVENEDEMIEEVHNEDEDMSEMEEEVDEDDDETVNVLHPQLEKLLEMLISDEKVIILKEQDLQKILFKPLKIQTHLIMKLTQKLEEIEQKLETAKEQLAESVKEDIPVEQKQRSALPSANQQLAKLKLRSRNPPQQQQQQQQQMVRDEDRFAEMFGNNNNDQQKISTSDRRRIRGAPPSKPKKINNKGSKRSIREVGITSTSNIRSLRKNAYNDREQSFLEEMGESEFDTISESNDFLEEPMTRPRIGENNFATDSNRISTRKSLRPQKNISSKGQDQNSNLKSLRKKSSNVIENTSDFSQLENLLDEYSQKNEDVEGTIDETEVDYDESAAGATMNAFFDRIYILNLTGKAAELESKLLHFGLGNYEIFEKVNPKKSLMENLYEVILNAQQHQYEQILVLKDNIHVHRDICKEFVRHQSKIKDDWKLLYFGAGMLKTSGQYFDPEFYVSLYPDLQESGINTVQGATRHWRSKGHREGRFGGRYLTHPEMTKDISALAIHSDFYPSLAAAVSPNQKRGGNIASNLAKLLRTEKPHSWVTVPSLFQNEITKLNQSKNQANMFLYI